MSKNEWGGRLGIILAVTGSAVGLGNFLRFPGLAAKYGGGTFMIPYFAAFLLLGLPIAYIEWSIARYGGTRGYHSAPGIFSVLWPKKISPYLGVLGLIVPIGIYMYYVFIEAWCLYYAWGFLTGALNLGTDVNSYKSFFESFTGSSADGKLFSGLSPAIISLLICYTLNFFFVYRGIAGIEKVSRWGMPVLLLIALIVLVRVMTLGTPNPALPERSVINGLGHLWNPPQQKSLAESLMNAQLWMEAAGQIFFSLSVGFGVIINYASYLSKKDDIMLSATTAAAGNEFAEVALGGLITVPAAFVFLGPMGIGGTFGLGFVSLPAVFAHMPLGQMFGALWFFLLFIAAITSSVSMLQPGIAFLEEGLRLDRRKSSAALMLVTLGGSLFVAYYSRGLEALDTMDFWAGTFFIFVLAIFQVIVAGWLFGVENVLAEAQEGSRMRIPRSLPWLIKYISPAFLLTIFVMWCVQYIPDQWKKIQTNTVTQITVLFLLGTLIALVIATHFAVRYWQLHRRPGGVA
ncbi:MAG: sodium-dependent transporter [Turneriella sp.]